MRNIILLTAISLQISSFAFANEYQKMFSCSQALKGEAQISNKAIAKDFTVLPVKSKGVEGVDLFLRDKIYFCKLPKKFISKNIDERLYKMNLSVPKVKPIYVSYLKSTTEPPSLEVMDLEDNIEISQEQVRLSKTKFANCTETRDPHSEKILAEFLRKEISHIHDKSSDIEFKLAPRNTVATLKLCEKSFLLKSVSDNEIKKFETRIPAASSNSALDE